MPSAPLADNRFGGDGSRWATMKDIEVVGWSEAVNSELDAEFKADSDGDEKLSSF